MLSDEHQILARRLSEYTWLAEKYAAKVRPLPNRDAIYCSVQEKWAAQVQPLMIPPKEDTEKRKEFFAFCDGLCKGEPEPTTPEACLEAVFAASAGVQALLNDTLAVDIAPETYSEIWKAVTANTFRELAKATPAAPETPTPSFPSLYTVPYNNYFPPAAGSSASESAPAPATHPAELLLGKPFSYQSENGLKTRRCTVEDFGTSRLRGPWFAVTHEDDELMISTREMDEILSQRV